MPASARIISRAEPAETMEQALANFSEYNARLAALLEQDELTMADLAQIHQLTYTLENALERINDDLEDLAETLETPASFLRDRRHRGRTQQR